jgi:CRP-like cAMP-binding protein
MREGDPGDRYVLIDRGEAEVTRLGEMIGRLGPMDGAGEIALVNDVPRTASVRAVSDIEAFALDRAISSKRSRAMPSASPGAPPRRRAPGRRPGTRSLMSDT